MDITKRKDKGFTLIELLVAMGIFSVFITVAIGGFSQALSNQRLVLKLMSATDTMSFSIEQMMREVRVGSNFTSPAIINDSTGSDTLTFHRTESGLNNGQTYEITYKYINDPDGGYIERKKALMTNDVPSDTSEFKRFTPNGINVTSFKVIAMREFEVAPTRITILIGVSVSDKKTTISNNIQTTVSSRVF